MKTAKLEIEIEITTCEDDLSEGTWHGYDTDGNLQSSVKVVIEGMCFAKWEDIRKKTGISRDPSWSKVEADLFDENGRVANEETSHGEFVCYREGLPR